MNTLVFPEIDARFEQLDNAVKVTQRGRTYLARKWQITAGLEHVIRTAIQFGYTSFWVDGHPSTPYLLGEERFHQGSHHITFARKHHEKWVFVADKAPDSSEVCFNRGLRDFMESIGESHEWEHSGGHNLRIPLSRLEHVLSQLDAEHVDNLHSRHFSAPAYVGRQTVLGLTNESDLHRHIIHTYTPVLQAAGAILQSKVRTGPKSVPDLLLDVGAKGLFILELKFTHVGLVEHDQLRKYLCSPLIVERSKERTLHGVLIGRDFSPELVALANQQQGKVSLYSFSHRAGQLSLSLVAGSPLLMQSVPQLFVRECEDTKPAPSPPPVPRVLSDTNCKEIAAMDLNSASASVPSPQRERIDPESLFVLVDTDGRIRIPVQRLEEGIWKYAVGNGRSGGETVLLEKIEDVVRNVVVQGRTVVARTIDRKGPSKRSGVAVPGKSIRSYWVPESLMHVVRNAPSPPMARKPERA